MPDPISDASKGLVQKIEGKYATSNDEVTVGELGKIGKPCVYHHTIDPDHRVSEFFKTRMNIVDLLPCHYKMDFSKITESDKDSSGLVPQVVYNEAMSNYKQTCGSYGLPSKSGIRVYTIDDTQASDSISNNLKENYFQTGVNKFSEMGSPIRQMLKSVDSNSIDRLTDEVSKKLNTKVGEGGGAASKLYSAAKDIVVKGHRITLPSIWKDSSYTPNFTANIRLASPYGHPKAVKEFVIKPLMYLLILASPETSDGVSYGQPFFLTLKGYGLNYSPIGVISNITLRRGGNDSSFNIFRQPLTIDVSLEFQYAVSGFAHYHYEHNDEAGIFGSSDQPEHLSKEQDTALPTIGHVVKSLRPRPVDSSVVKGHSSISEARNTKPDGSQGGGGSVIAAAHSAVAGMGTENSPFSKNSIVASQDAASLASSNQTATNISSQLINSSVGNAFA